MKTQLGKLLAVLNQGLVEREEAIKVALLAALAGEHVLLLGPPGTAKSLLARRIARLFGDDYFEYLLTKFTTPDELFGPLSLSALKADRFERKVQGYLPTARIAFLDEIFKANSSILNALLALLNERVFHNGEKRQSAPLQALIAASNELPEDDEALAALYDRFLLRLHVGGVSDAALPRLFEDGDEPALAPLPLTEVDALRERARRVTLPQEVGDALKAIWLAH
ncbi:MAG: AAA family ATPase, partial [Casimicrobiaceae bacterium]|nr:AAA family ATPase [Casimicrobiaceae bacterium]